MIYNSFQKGQFKSPYIQDGFSSLVNCDVHTKLGSLQSQVDLTIDSTTPNENCVLVSVPSGIIFAISNRFTI